MTAKHDMKKLVEEIYAVRDRGDIEGTLALTGEDCTFRIVGNARLGPFSSEAAGPHAFRQAITQLITEWDLSDYQDSRHRCGRGRPCGFCASRRRGQVYPVGRELPYGIRRQDPFQGREASQDCRIPRHAAGRRDEPDDPNRLEHVAQNCAAVLRRTKVGASKLRL